jgi:hypothetical protein
MSSSRGNSHARIIRHLALIAFGGLAAACAAQPPGQAATSAPAAATQEPAVTAAPAALVIQTDTVLGPKNLTDEEKKVKTCIQANKFAHNEQIVWRVRVIDGATGEALDDQAVSTVELKLPDETLTLKYGPHPKKDPFESFWTVSWVVPEDYPSGTIPYTLTAAGSDGRSGSYEQFKVPPAMLTVTDDVRAVIPE